MNTAFKLIFGTGLVLLAGAALFFGLRNGDGPAPEPPPTGSVATLAPGPTGQPDPAPGELEPTVGPDGQPTVGPTEDPAVVNPEPVTEEVGEELPFPGLLSTLAPEEEAAAADFASQVAAAVTTQIPGEYRYGRLEPYFTDESNGPGHDGPLSEDTTVEPISVDWAAWTETGNETELGRVVTVRYGSSAGGQYTEGAVTWELRLVRSGAGWLASYIDMGSTS